MGKTTITCVMVLSLAAGTAVAGEKVDAPTVTGETGLFTLLTAETLPQGEWSFGLYYNNWDRLVLEDSAAPLPAPFSSEWDYDWHRLSASIGYGITENFEISLMLPYEEFDASDNNRFGRINGRYYVNEVDASGAGNLRLAAKWRITDTGNGGFALNPYVELETGDDDEGVVTGDTGFGLNLAYQAGNWVVNAGYHDPGDADTLSVPEEISLGIGYAATVTERLDWITEAQAIFFEGTPKPSDDVLDVTTGGRLWFGETERWAFNFGLRSNVIHLSDTDEFCPIGGLLGLTYYPRSPTPPPPPPPPPPPAEYTLTVRKQGSGQGTVTSRPAGINCGSDCSARYQDGTEVMLTAAASRGSTFEGWSGDADCSDGNVTMTADRSCVATFEAPEPPPPPPPPPPEIKEVCYFAANSARVDNRCKATLDEVALRMKNETERWALVIGYTDSTGSDASNQRMSEKRAEAVKGYLVSRHGIDPSRITTEGRGSADPVGDNNTAEGRGKNRRAEITLKVR